MVKCGGWVLQAEGGRGFVVAVRQQHFLSHSDAVSCTPRIPPSPTNTLSLSFGGPPGDAQWFVSPASCPDAVSALLWLSLGRKSTRLGLTGDVWHFQVGRRLQSPGWKSSLHSTAISSLLGTLSFRGVCHTTSSFQALWNLRCRLIKPLCHLERFNRLELPSSYIILIMIIVIIIRRKRIRIRI